MASATPTRNRGAVLLGKVDATQDSIAERTGTSRQAVAKWLSGASRPGAPMRKKLARAFKVPVAAWDEAAAPRLARQPPPVAQRPPQPELETTLAALDLDPLGDDIEADGDTSIARAEALDAWCKRALLELPQIELDSKAATIAEKLGRTLMVIAKLRGELDIGKNLLKLPQWKAAERAIEVALRGHPAAARTVADALRKLEAEIA